MRRKDDPTMRTMFLSFLPALLYIESPTPKTAGNEVYTGTQYKKTVDKPAGKEKPLTKESAWTWGYFFASKDKAAVAALAGERPHALNVYRVDKVVAVRGQPGVDLESGGKGALIRMETATRLSAAPDDMPKLLFHGVPQHLQYTTGEQKADLNKRSRFDLAPGKDTVAVIIPIRKSAVWWALPADERMAHFQKQGDEVGHTAIGAKYVDRIYRKLYHTRYAVETRDHDFITYFEFERAHTDDFKHLLAQLRDPRQNPEWNFVDREYEIWLTKTE
jgi:Chlorite dismutase